MRERRENKRGERKKEDDVKLEKQVVEKTGNVSLVVSWYTSYTCSVYYLSDIATVSWTVTC